MRIMLMFLVVLFMNNASAMSYETDFPLVASNVTTNLYSARVAETNRLNQIIAVTTNATHLAACRLVKAVLLLDVAEEELSDDAFIEATNLCTIVGEEFEEYHSWPYFASKYVMIGALSFDKQLPEAFCIATNTLSIFDRYKPVSLDANAWAAISMREMQTNLSIRAALCAEAALNLAVQGRSAEVNAFTNGLPQRVLDVVRSLKGEGDL